MLHEFHAERQLLFGNADGRTPKMMEELARTAWQDAEAARELRIEAEIDRLSR